MPIPTMVNYGWRCSCRLIGGTSLFAQAVYEPDRLDASFRLGMVGAAAVGPLVSHAMFRLSIWTAGERLTVLQVAELRKEVDRKSARNAEKRHHTNPAQLFARTALVQVGAAAVPALLGPRLPARPCPSPMPPPALISETCG